MWFPLPMFLSCFFLSKMPQMPPHPTAITPFTPACAALCPPFNFYFLIVIISALETFFFALVADKNRLVPFWEGCVGGGDSLLFLSCGEQSAELRGGTRAAVTRSPLPAQGSQIPRVLPQNHWLGCPRLPLAKLDRWSQHPRWGHPSCCPAPLPACAPFFFFFFSILQPPSQQNPLK